MPDVTPDDDNDGVEVWRHRFDDDEFWMEWEDENRGNDRTPYRAFKTLRAEQLLAIEEAARDRRATQAEFDPSSFRSASAVTDATDRLNRALDALTTKED